MNETERKLAFAVGRMTDEQIVNYLNSVPDDSIAYEIAMDEIILREEIYNNEISRNERLHMSSPSI